MEQSLTTYTYNVYLLSKKNKTEIQEYYVYTKLYVSFALAQP